MRIECECGIGIHIKPGSDGEECWKCKKFVKVKKEEVPVLPDLKDI